MRAAPPVRRPGGRGGRGRSSSSRKRIPSQNPIVAGRNDHAPKSAAPSSAGINRLHMLAATITPAAKPLKPFCTFSGKSRLRKKTSAAPSVVPRKGTSSPCKTCVFMKSGYPLHSRTFTSAFFLHEHMVTHPFFSVKGQKKRRKCKIAAAVIQKNIISAAKALVICARMVYDEKREGRKCRLSTRASGLRIGGFCADESAC